MLLTLSQQTVWNIRRRQRHLAVLEAAVSKRRRELYHPARLGQLCAGRGVDDVTNVQPFAYRAILVQPFRKLQVCSVDGITIDTTCTATFTAGGGTYHQVQVDCCSTVLACFVDGEMMTSSNQFEDLSTSAQKKEQFPADTRHSINTRTLVRGSAPS